MPAVMPPPEGGTPTVADAREQKRCELDDGCAIYKMRQGAPAGRAQPGGSGRCRGRSCRALAVLPELPERPRAPGWRCRVVERCEIVLELGRRSAGCSGRIFRYGAPRRDARKRAGPPGLERLDES